MAVHNFDYTYSYVSCKASPKAFDDPTLVVREVTIAVTAVDQAAPSQSITLNQSKVLDHHHILSAEELPENFIPIDDITQQQMIDWYLEEITTETLDGFFTWQLYGAEEVSPIESEQPV